MADIINLQAFEGINRSVPDHLMKDTELRLCVNATSDITGTKMKRKGWNRFLDNPDDKPVQLMFFWHKVNGDRFIFRVSGTKLYKYKFGIGQTTWAVAKSGLTDGVRMTCAPLMDKLYFTNGTDNMFYTSDGTAFTDVTIGTPPKPKYITVFHNRLYAAGSSTDIAGQTTNTGPSSLYWSVQDNGTDWTVDLTNPAAAGYQYIDPDFGGKITGLSKILNRILIFKQDEMYKYDDVNHILTDLDYTSTTSNYSVAPLKDNLFFINRDGIWQYPGTSAEIMSIPLYDIITNIPGSSIVDASAIVYRRHYLCSVGDITTDDGYQISNCVLDFDFDDGQWLTHNYPSKPTAWVIAKDENNNENIYYGDSDGRTLFLSTNDYDHTTPVGDPTLLTKPIQMVIETKNYDEGNPQIDKKYNKVYVEASPRGQMEIFFSMDDGDWFQLGDLYDSLSKHYFSPKNTGAYNKKIKFRIVDDSKGPQSNFKRLIFYREVSGGEK